MKKHIMSGVFSSYDESGKEFDLEYTIERKSNQYIVTVCRDKDCITETLNVEDYSGIEGVLNWIIYDVPEQYFWEDVGCVGFDSERDNEIQLFC